MNNLQKALNIYMENDIQRIEEEMLSEDPPKFSSEFEKRMRGLIRSVRDGDFEKADLPTDNTLSKHKTVRIFGRNLRRTFVIAAVITLILAMTITTIAIIKPEIWFDIRKGIGDWGITSNYEMDSEDTGYDVTFELITPNAPRGYYIVETHKFKNDYNVSYKDDDGHFIDYSQFLPDGATVFVDSEGEIFETTIRGQEAIVAHHDGGSSTIVIENDKYVISLSGDCTYEELLKMATDIVDSSN